MSLILSDEFSDDEVSKYLKFADNLNPKIWDSTGDMIPKVRATLLKNALEYVKYIGVDNMKISDVIITGSNAAYNYTNLSDIDIHIITDYSAFGALADNFFRAKKALWGETYNITVRGLPVEMYVEDIAEPVNANGIFSILRNEWIKKPSKEIPEFDNHAVVAKTNAYADEIASLINNDPSVTDIEKMQDKLRKLRQAGFEKSGEYSIENLAFKSLRNLGVMDDLWDARVKAYEKDLTLETLNEVRLTNSSGLPFDVVKNPSRRTFENLAKKHESLRALLSYDGNTLYVWPAYMAIHQEVYYSLGLEYIDCLYYYFGEWRGPINIENYKYPPAIERVTPYDETKNFKKDTDDAEAIDKWLHDMMKNDRDFSELIGESTSKNGKLTLYHITNKAKFSLNKNYQPEDNAISLTDRSGHSGIYLTTSVEEWVNKHGYLRPFVVIFQADPSITKYDTLGRWGNEIFVPAEHFDKLKIERVIPIDAYAREQFGSPGWIEDDNGFEFDTGNPISRRTSNKPKYDNYIYPGDVRNEPANVLQKYRKFFKAGIKHRFG